jgi:hypothetical protein
MPSAVKSGPFTTGLTAQNIALTSPSGFSAEFMDTAQEIFTDARGYANGALAEIQAHLANLVAFALQSWNIPIPETINNPIDFWDFAQAKLEEIINNRPTMPTIADITTSPPDAPTVDLPIPDEIEIPDFAYEAADLDEDALWNKARDRETIKLEGELEEIKRDQASTGFTMPQGSLVKVIDKARLNFEMVLSDLNREIPLKAIEIFKARADVYKTVIEGKRVAIEAKLLQFKTRVEALQAQISLFDADIKAYMAKLHVLEVNNTLHMEGYKAEVTGYSAEVDAIAKEGQIAVQAADLQYKAQLAALTSNIEISKLKLEEIVEQNKLRITAETSIGDIYRNIASAALSALHATASISTGQTFTEGFQVSNQSHFQVSKGDNYTETQNDLNEGDTP